MTKPSCKIAHVTDLHWRDCIEGTSASPVRQSRLVGFAFADLLQDLKRQGIEMLLLTGDLVDVPFPIGCTPRSLVIEEYTRVKQLLDASGLRYLALPGNHDDPDCFFEIFPRERQVIYKGFEFISFFDYQLGSQPISREGEEWDYLQTFCAEKGPRNQIHLQHYLITPEKNQGYPHTYANAAQIMTCIEQSERVLLSVSGHYHPGSDVEKRGQTFYYTGKSFSEGKFNYALIQLNGEEVSLQQTDMRERCAQSPLISPYRHGGKWYQGNLHTHCSENSPCSVIPLDAGIDLFMNSKTDTFIAVTDHDVIADISGLQQKYPEFIFYEGFEHSVSNHMLFIAEKAAPLFLLKDKREALQQTRKEEKEYLTIVCHPQGPKKDYWTVQEILTYPVLPSGVEVFNGHYGVGAWRQKGFGWDYTEFWAECLDAGLRVHAYANDDFHDGDVDLHNGWNVALATERSAPAILSALRQGSCYATTGIRMVSIQEYSGHVVIVFDQKVDGRFIGPQSQILSSAQGTVFEYTYAGEAFIRFEAESNGRKCWTQPMYAQGI